MELNFRKASRSNFKNILTSNSSRAIDENIPQQLRIYRENCANNRVSKIYRYFRLSHSFFLKKPVLPMTELKSGANHLWVKFLIRNEILYINYVSSIRIF